MKSLAFQEKAALLRRMKIRKDLNGLAKSFSYAFDGIKFCIKNERNMRIHITAAFYVIAFSFFYNFTKAEYCLIFLTISSVIVTEMLNTAVETLVDMVSPHYSGLAKIAKNIAAGAVFVSAIFAAAVGFFLYFQPKVLLNILNFLKNPFMLLALIISLIISAIFIFSGVKKTIK